QLPIAVRRAGCAPKRGTPRARIVRWGHSPAESRSPPRTACVRRRDCLTDRRIENGGSSHAQSLGRVGPWCVRGLYTSVHYRMACPIARQKPAIRAPFFGPNIDRWRSAKRVDLQREIEPNCAPKSALFWDGNEGGCAITIRR